MDEDFLLAVQLQEQYDSEASTSLWNKDGNYDQINKKRKIDADCAVISISKPYVDPEKPISIVDESWEVLDPSPDVRAMFLSFNDKFFWGKLGGVEVKWSSRMTLCAGICSYEGRGGLCSIRLSEPLLKLRPRRDLVQTLLHEMIHAFLFVTQNNRDRDGHGPEFCKHMDRINKASGTKITVYHTFHDEVDLYRQHWWRCNGPCQNRRPYFGYVKRAMNRPPSALDPWWPDHQRSCGGTYIKIKEPENYGKKGKTGENEDEKTRTQPMKKNKSSSTVTGKTGVQDIRNVLPFSGRGFVLGGNPLLTSTKKSPAFSVALPSDSSGYLKVPGSPSTTVLVKNVNLPSQTTTSKETVQTVVSSSFGKPQNLPSSSLSSGKKSVSNTKAFININGSPVRIYGTGNHLNRPPHNQSGKTIQKSVADLFHTKDIKPSPKPGLRTSMSPSKSAGPSDDSRNGTTSISSLNSKSITEADSRGLPSALRQAGIHASAMPVISKANSADSLNSGCLKSPQKSGPTLPVSRKRPWDSRVPSAHIFEFFQRSSATSNKVRQPRQEPPLSNLPPNIQPVPVSASPLIVACPVCQSTVLECEINSHLDSCLT